MTYEQLEKYGFTRMFYPAERRGTEYGARWKNHIGKSFRVVGRVNPMKYDPMWVIEFHDGFRMAAYPEEVLRCL